MGAVRKSLPICVLDNNPDHIQASLASLQEIGYPALGATNPAEALRKIRAGECRAVLADLQSAQEQLEFLKSALQYDPGQYVILASNSYTVEQAIEAIRNGAYDYVRKPLDAQRLAKTLEELAESFSQRSQIRGLQEKLFENLQFHGIVGRSPAMIEVFELVKKVARHYTNALIIGPTGSGKELIARALHQLSPVARERFAVCACAALPDSLLESQLFGQSRSAFASTAAHRAGLFESVEGGTVFLDEIGEISPPIQARLLRMVQSREIQRIGPSSPNVANVRLIASTNRDLRSDVSSRRFREDLFYRLANIEIRVPSLAERVEDIPVLVQYFLKKYGQAYDKKLQGLTQRAQIALMQHDWPGNVRELENAISSAAIASDANFIDVADLPEYLTKRQRHAPSEEPHWRPLPLDEIRSAHIQRVLESCKGNRVRAAQMLGIGRTSLYRFLKRSGEEANTSGNEI